MLNWLKVLPLCKNMYDRPWTGVHAIFLEVKQFTSKTEHYEALSLFLVKYSVLNLFLVLAHMQFPILDHYIHMSRHRKGSI